MGSFCICGTATFQSRYSSACSRSAIRSPASSNPTEKRNRFFGVANAAITLALTDFLEPYPDVSVQLVMLGGSIPYVVEHIQQWSRFSGVTIDAAAKFRRLYFDPGPYSVTPLSVQAAIRAFGADRILFGSDYGPMPTIQSTFDTLDLILSPLERQLIYVDNGRALLAAKGIKLPL